MTHATLVFGSVSLLVLAACGGSVVTGDAAGTASGAGGGAASSTSGAGGKLATSASASSVSSSASSSASASSTAGAGGSGACNGVIEVVEDNGAPKKLTSICPGSWGSNMSTSALGYEFSGGPFPGTQALSIAGCAGMAAQAQGVHLSATNAKGPGKYTKGSASYTDTMGKDWTALDGLFEVTVSKLDPVGGVIEGSFSATVTQGGNAAHSISGTFHVCRVQDELAP